MRNAKDDCINDGTSESPVSHRNEPMRAEPLDRMEELAKLQERRQQRLVQLRELRQGKPVSSWTTDLSRNDVKLTAPKSSSPKLQKKMSTRSTLSKSLPPYVTPPFANHKLLKKTSSAAERVEGRGRSAAPTAPMKREESPHPARLLRRMKSVDAPGDDVDFNRRPTSKPRNSSAQKQRKISNSRQSNSNVRANTGNVSHLNTTSPQQTRFPNVHQMKSTSGIVSDLNDVIVQAEAVGHTRQATQTPNIASTDTFNDPSLGSRPNQSRNTNHVSSKQQLPSLNRLLDDSSDIDYTQSAEELSQLIAAMRAEFKILRDAKVKAEATADKLRTELSLQQQETEAQLLALSRENECLKSTEIKLQLELNQGNEKLNKVEKEKCVLRSKLLKCQNEKISAETKSTILEAENGALHKALLDLAKRNSYGGPVPEELIEDDGIQISRYARLA